ncbi:HAD family hydrolase [Sodalis praecaptivus]|uniref:HAD family hydrolase n=1 Tax=Sodalis TaxID=84565 RepID=UPI00046D84FF|nr:HAD family hydrolase [Sodalis praecaptivus]
MAIKAVFFDVGETLVDESREWAEWADFLGLSRLTFFAALGAVIARGEHHRRIFRLVRPDSDFQQLQQQREQAGKSYRLRATDLYPDALPCLRRLRQAGILVGIAGNQPQAVEQALRLAGVPADIIRSSASWGVEKPDPRFFQQILAATPGLKPSEVAYVGDRLDNDVLPARQAGMLAVFLRRGPWALLQDARRETPGIALDDLHALPAILCRQP